MLHIHTFRKHFLEGVYFPVSILFKELEMTESGSNCLSQEGAI